MTTQHDGGRVLRLLLVVMAAALPMCSALNVVVGLNPALQKTVSLNSLVVGSVNRGQELVVGIGGKGQNVKVATSCMDCRPEGVPELVQFVGSSSEGDALMEQLATRTGERGELTVRAAGRCRTAITLVDSGADGEATEIVEPSDPVTADEVAQLLALVRARFDTEKVGAMAVMGSMPPGCPGDLYAQLVRECCGPGSKLVLDTTAGLADVLAAAGEAQCQALLKVNARELCGIAKVEIEVGSENALATPLDRVRAAVDTLWADPAFGGLDYVAATDGTFPATLFARGGPTFRLTSGKLPGPVLSPVGAGDAVASGTLMHWAGALQTANADEASAAIQVRNAVVWGLACGGASCLTPSCSVFDTLTAEALCAAVQVEELPAVV